jgi:hypothetical protein
LGATTSLQLLRAGEHVATTTREIASDNCANINTLFYLRRTINWAESWRFLRASKSSLGACCVKILFRIAEPRPQSLGTLPKRSLSCLAAQPSQRPDIPALRAPRDEQPLNAESGPVLNSRSLTARDRRLRALASPIERALGRSSNGNLHPTANAQAREQSQSQRFVGD